MKVTGELKEIIRRKLHSRKKEIQQLYEKSENKKWTSDFKKLKKLHEKNKQISTEINRISNNIKKHYTFGYKYGYCSISNGKLEFNNYVPNNSPVFNVDEELYLIIEKLELAGKNGSMLKDIFDKIKKLGD